MYDEPPAPPKHKLWAKVKSWVKTHRTRTYLIVGAVLIAIAGATAWAILSRPLPEVKTVYVPPKPKPKPVYYSPLTGLKVKNQAATAMPVTAIMIENSPDARPQSGLKQAGVVYEAIAEGGITRFLTLHQQDKPQLVGPVRSLRMYYVDWLAPYQASVAHVGGSRESLNEIRNGSYRDIDQFFNAGSYWRATDRWAPHNVYTSFAKLDALNKQKGYKTSKFKGFARTDGKPAKKPGATKIAINFSSPLFNTAYTYDKKHNRYLRSQAGEPHVDREDGQIAPSVVIALKIDMSLVLQDGYREDIKTTGSGEAVIFQNGTAKKAVWHKPSRKAQLSFTDKKGKAIPLVRGQTWIAAIPNNSGSVTWQ